MFTFWCGVLYSFLASKGSAQYGKNAADQIQTDRSIGKRTSGGDSAHVLATPDIKEDAGEVKFQVSNSRFQVYVSLKRRGLIIICAFFLRGT
jgi:hypothetical protein